MTLGRRLFLSFGSLVAGFALALFFAFSALRSVDPILETIKHREKKAQLLLELDATVRDRYAHDGGATPVAGHEEARRRIQDLQLEILQRLADPEAQGWMADIERGTGELERLHDEKAEAAASGRPLGDPGARLRRGYELLLLVDERVERLRARHYDAAVQLREQVSAAQRSTLRWIVAFLVAAPLFAIGVGLHLRRAVARPAAALGAAAQRLARGEMDARVEVTRADELGVLATRFNAMAEALRHHQERQNEKLASIGRLAAGVAHELNSPLSVMIGYLLLHRRKAHGGLARDLLAVEREALHCKEIVQDLLEFARPAGVPSSAPVDLRALCEEVVAELRDSGHVADARFHVGGAGEVLGNRTKLRQVILNLARNGAEAAGSGGWVDIRVDSSAEAVEVAVTDSGHGISADARTRIFEPFFTTKPAGTGLGLAVSRAIARAHGGELAIRETEARGAVLAMRLPRASEGA